MESDKSEYTADSRERLLKKIEFNGGSIEFILSMSLEKTDVNTIRTNSNKE